MEDEKLDSGLKEIRGITMSPHEKNHILESILNSPPVPIRLKPSPYVFISRFTQHHFIYIAISSLCLVLFLSGGAIFASRGSLPGGILYPLKVGVVEPIGGLMTFSPLAKVTYESGLASKRLAEAEILAGNGWLDAEKEKQLNTLLESHTAAFNDAVSTLQEDASSENNDDTVVTNFQATLNAHAQLLDVINGHNPVLKTDTEKHDTISKIARDSALKTRDSLKNKNKQNKKSGDDQKRKDAVQSLINQTVQNVNTVVSEKNSKKEIVVHDTHDTLDQAQKFLQEVDEEDKKGNSENAHERLLDSESSAKQADIFLNIGLKI